MTWLFPTFLAGVLAIAVPIALHFLRRQPKRVIVFPSLRFLAVAHQRTEKKHRLLRLIVLTLRCLALALLAAAFARPFFAARDLRSGRSTVIVVDNSFSVQAKGRWEKLRSWTRTQVGTLRSGDKLGILVMGPVPTWLVPLNSDTAATLGKLEQLQPGWYSTRAEPALHLAGDTLAALGGAERRIIFLGDHQRVSWTSTDFSAQLPPGVSVIFPPVAEAVARQAALLPPTLGRTDRGVHVSLPIRNFTGPQSRKLHVYRDSEIISLHDEAIELDDRETRTVQFDLPAGSAGVARFRFALDPDDLPADDTFYAIWQTGADHALLLDPATAGNGADYLATALAATAALKPALAIAPPPAGAWPAGAVAVLRNDASFSGAPAARLETFLREGGSALVFIEGGPAQRKWLAENHQIAVRSIAATKDKLLEVHDWAMDHPVVAAMAEHEVSPLLGWSFRQGWGLPTDAVESLALWTDDSAAIGETHVGAGRLLLCGFPPDRHDGDWPVHAAFVPFLHRAVSYFFGAPSNTAAVTTKVGYALSLPMNSGNWRALDGPALSEPTHVVTSPVKPSMPGVYEFGEGAARKLFAVNLAPEESDPAGWSEGTPWLGLVSSQSPAALKKNQPPIPLAALDAEQRSPLWWWLFVAVAFLLLAELGLANRTAR